MLQLLAKPRSMFCSSGSVIAAVIVFRRSRGYDLQSGTESTNLLQAKQCVELIRDLAVPIYT